MSECAQNIYTYTIVLSLALSLSASSIYTHHIWLIIQTYLFAVRQYASKAKTFLNIVRCSLKHICHGAQCNSYHLVGYF